jgi:hypothetical protein
MHPMTAAQSHEPSRPGTIADQPIMPTTAALPTNRACSTKNLEVSAGGGDGGGQHAIYFVSAKNVGQTGCTLAGRPRVLVAGVAHPTWQYPGSWMPEGPTPAHLQPGASAGLIISTVSSCDFPHRLWEHGRHFTDLAVTMPDGAVKPVEGLTFDTCYQFQVSHWYGSRA